MTQKNTANVMQVETTESDGAISGTISAKSNTTQEINASSGALSGSSVQFPPGSLAVSTNVTVEEGSSVANDANSSSLGINSSVNSASPALVVSSSTEQDPANPFTLQIPVSSSSSLALTSTTYYVVIYKAVKYSDGGKVLIGVIPHSAISIESGKAKFNVKYFGVYQVAKVDSLIEQAKEVESSSPILTKREEKKLPPITFSSIILTASATPRAVNVSATISDSSTLKNCILIADKDKIFPWEQRKESSAAKIDFSPSSAQGETWYFQFQCGFADGRILHSPWSDSFAFSGLDFSVSGVPSADMAAGMEFEITISGNGIKEYKYVIAKGDSVDCSKQTYSTWLALTVKSKIKSSDIGKISLCIIGHDHSNNETSAKRWQWSQISNENAISLTANGNPSVSGSCLLSQSGTASFESGISYSSSSVAVSGITTSGAPSASNTGYSFTVTNTEVTPGRAFSAVWTVNGSSSATKTLTANYQVTSSDIFGTFSVPVIGSGIGFPNFQHPMVGLQPWEINQPCSQAGKFSSLAPGDWHTCYLKDDGFLSCWGENSLDNQLGDGSNTDQDYPVNVANLTPVGLISAVSAGYGHTCALAASGVVLCWGNKTNGKIGDGYSSGSTNVPLYVLTAGTDQSASRFSNAVAIAAGFDHNCALNSSGQVLCWGANNRSQVGQSNGTITYNYPTVVSGLSDTIIGIATGKEFSCALTNSGAVRCWGEQLDGRLGNGSTATFAIASATAVKSSASVELSGAVGIALGYDHACAVMSDGKIRCWGRNNFGQLGDGSVTYNSFASIDVVGIGGGSTKAVAVAATFDHSCALLEDGSVKCWGDNSNGQLGDGTTTNSSIPVNVSVHGEKVVALELGKMFSCAITASQKIYCWGYGWNIFNAAGGITNNPTPVLMKQSAGGPAITNAAVRHPLAATKN